MTTSDNDTLQQVIAQFEDTIADNSKIRDGLHDAEAIPFVDWGVAYAHDLARQMVAGDAPPDEEQVSERAYNLTRLMSRLNWVVTYRSKKDPAWLTKTFQMINKLSQDLKGADAPTMTDDEITAWIEAQVGQSNADLLQGLMARYAPPAPAQEPESDAATPDDSGEGGSVVDVLTASFPEFLFGAPPRHEQPDSSDDTASSDDTTLL